MAFNNAEGRSEYTASAGQTLFPFNFKIYNDEDIKVYLTPAGQDADDAVDILTLNTHYTVTINGDLGGDVTLVTGAGVGDAITEIRELSIDRFVEYQTSGDLLANTLNLDQDYQTYLIQDQSTKNSRYITLPDSSQGVSTELPSPIGDAYLIWANDGKSISNDTTIPQSAVNAAASAAAALVSEQNSLTSANNSETSAVNSEDSNLDAESWANEDENIPVKEHTSGTPTDIVPTAYSAKHYAQKAIAGGTDRTSARNVAISASASGVLAESSTPTPSHKDVIYTGNGTSQDVITGLPSVSRPWVSSASYTIGDYKTHEYVIYEALTTHTGVATAPDADATNWVAIADGAVVDADNADVWIKNRSSALEHIRCSTLIGIGKFLSTDTTAAEVIAATTLTSFNDDGFSVGSSGHVNGNTNTLVAWCEYFDKMVSGVTNHGKRYITAFNAQSGKSITTYVGSGIAGHEIPHFLGTLLDIMTFKNRDAITNWPTQMYFGDASPRYNCDLNLNSADNGFVGALNSATSVSLQTTTDTGFNTLNDNFIVYASSNRKNHTYTGSYVGTGSAGNPVDVGMDLLALDTAGKNIKVMVKRLDSVAEWSITDTERVNGSLDGRLYADDSSSEVISSDILSYTSNGIILNQSFNSYNASGGQYLIEVTVEDYDAPNGGLDIPAGSVISYAEGTDHVSGDLDSIEATILHDDITLVPSAKNYIYMSKGNIPSASIYPIIKTIDYTVPVVNYDIYEVEEGILHEASTGTQISKVALGEVVVDASGVIIPETLVEYQVGHVDLPELEVHGDTVLHGDMVVDGDILSNYTLQAWARINSDGSIESSDKVSHVIKAGAGLYDVYTEDIFNNIDDAIALAVPNTSSAISANCTNTAVNRFRVHTYIIVTPALSDYASYIAIFGRKS